MILVLFEIALIHSTIGFTVGDSTFELLLFLLFPSDSLSVSSGSFGHWNKNNFCRWIFGGTFLQSFIFYIKTHQEFRFSTLILTVFLTNYYNKDSEKIDFIKHIFTKRQGGSMKSNKPIALILFGIAVIICASGYVNQTAAMELIAFPILCTGLFISLIGLIWALKQK